MGDVWKHSIDAKILERIFAAPDSEPDPFGELAAEKFKVQEQQTQDDESYQEELNEKRLRLKKFFFKLPARERDMIIMRFVEGKSQPQIAEFFGITQAAISYRIQRALRRLSVYNQMLEIDEDQMKLDLKVLFDELTVNVLMTIFETSTQSETARLLQKSQFCIRARFFDALRILTVGLQEKRWKPEFLERIGLYVGIFELIRRNWHILKEKLHKWKKSDRIV